MSEAEEQRAIVQWFKSGWPEHERALRVSMGGVNFGYGAKAARKQAVMRSQGVIKGEADIAILLPRGGFGCLLVEHKAEGGAHKATDAQIAYIEYHNANGNCAVITRGIEAAKAAIQHYMSAGN